MFNEFLKFEKENRLFLEEYEGVRYWHLIRDWAYYNLVKPGEEADTIDSRINKGGGAAKKAYVILANMMTHIFQLTRQKKTVDVLVSRAYGYRLVDGKPKDIFIEPLKMEEYLRYKVYEYSQFKDITSRSNYSSCYADVVVGVRTLYFLLAQQIHRYKGPNKNDDIKRIESMVSSLNKTFGINVDNVIVMDRIAYSVMAYKIYYKQARKVLIKTGPKAVILVCAYGIRNYAMCRATKDLGIPTIELQHGVIGPRHTDYNYEERVSSSYYYPDYLLTFGKYWNETCRTPYSCRKVAIGYAFLEEYSHLREENRTQNKTAVFYSNITDEFADLCKSFYKIAENEFEIIFKYHPTECGIKKYKQLQNLNIEVVATPEDVYRYLTKYTHHIAAGSTVLYEAVLMGGCGYNYAGESDKNGDSHQDSGEKLFLNFRNARELLKTLRMDQIEKSYDPIVSNNYFCKANATDNFRMFIEGIIADQN